MNTGKSNFGSTLHRYILIKHRKFCIALALNSEIGRSDIEQYCSRRSGQREGEMLQKTISHYPVSIEYLLCPHPFQQLCCPFFYNVALGQYTTGIFFGFFSLVRFFLPSKKNLLLLNAISPLPRHVLASGHHLQELAWSSLSLSDVSRSERNVVLQFWDKEYY